MDQSAKILTTQDGSHTLYSNRYQQPFHSIHGALTESRHVFLKGAEIENLFKSKSRVAILEIGFGAGLNWLLTASLALRHRVHLAYTASDQRIPCGKLLSDLCYSDLVEFHSLSEAFIKWRNTVPDKIPDGLYQPTFKESSTLRLQIGDATTIPIASRSYDRIYLDAFDPRVNPELWTLEFMGRLYDALYPGGILATYCAAGHVRRALSSSGFSVIRRPGPPGKREVLAAWKPLSP